MLRKLEYTRQTKETLAANLRNMKKLVFDDTNFEKIYTESREKRYLISKCFDSNKTVRRRLPGIFSSQGKGH